MRLVIIIVLLVLLLDRAERILNNVREINQHLTAEGK